ncbi:MAG: hypothetical protein WBI17_07215 [Clostridiaceae bacterium]
MNEQIDPWEELREVLQVLQKTHTANEILAASVKILCEGAKA